LTASKQFSDAQQRVREIEEKIKEIDEGRSLSKFILERVQADDYRKYLGIISTIRRDFDNLDKLLPLGASFGSGSEVVRIDRIILYIDDLDRCPEDKVVEVLQAIHLLLAFKLFVVVVGVDSRWLFHSLRLHSSAFGDLPGSGQDPAYVDRGHWQSTPLNYLEKIFQIPFALRPMSKGGFQRLLDNLTEQLTPVDQTSEVGTPALSSAQGTPMVPEATQSSAAPNISEAKSVSPTLPAINVSVFDPDPEPLRLKECERTFMWRFQPLIPSPRAAKRFANIYRLVRVSVNLPELDSFVRDDEGGEYQVVQLLLAIQTGYPEQAMRIIGDLIEHKPKNSWRDFVRTYDSEANPSNQSGTGETTAPSRATVNLEAQTWREFLERLDRVSPDVFANKSCDEFAKWGPRVARYSFQSARVLPFALTDL
jgi:KAP-like P-loop domain-containing protein